MIGSIRSNDFVVGVHGGLPGIVRPGLIVCPGLGHASSTVAASIVPESGCPSTVCAWYAKAKPRVL